MLKYEKETNLNMEEAEKKVTASLKEQGFGILTRIDVKEKMKEKLGVNHTPYIILGACSPRLAHQVLSKNQDVGYLLPCNVLVYKKEGKTVVGTVVPQRLLSLVSNEEGSCEEAIEAGEKLKKAIDSVEGEK